MTRKFIKLNLGLLLFAFGIFATLQANIGAAPWDAFHQGLALKMNLTFGQASIIVGATIVVINIFFKEKIGIGTLLNILIIGLLIDLFYQINLLPKMTHLASGIGLMVLGMVIIAFATYYYIDAGLGIGPRDGLMVIMVKLTNKPVGLIRLLIESSVLLVGYLLGGQVGIGTIILALGMGPIIQIVFGLLNFKIEHVKHDYLFSQP